MQDDWMDEVVPRLKNSSIYSALSDKCRRDQAGDHVMALVKDAVLYAYNRSKTIIRHMNEFTLHDSEHLFRVLRIMDRIVSEKNLEAMQAPDLFLLVLTAFFHDIGMAPSESTVLIWKKYWDINPCVGEGERNEFDHFSRFCSARPDKTKEISTLYKDGNVVEADVKKQYLIADYIRGTHGQRTRQIIQTDWNEKIRYHDMDLTVEFAEICCSHTDDVLKISSFDKQLVCSSGTFACPQLIAIVLRLADILDFDGKRTPSVLFSHLFVRHPASLSEWRKHRSVEAWEISEQLIRFHAKCTHPAVESSIHLFCDIIDKELSACSNLLNEINEYNTLNKTGLIFKIPYAVDRTKIETKKDISGKPLYNFKETRFSLSKRQVVDLLMGTRLYGNPEVALRELIQNSIDACLLRKSLELYWGNSYSPCICIKLYSENGDDMLEVSDNGIGMDQYIIDHYYSKIGSSFYKSPDFYDIQSQAGATFVPTSRFGIGILSCFMVADNILVDTRRLYGPHKSSDPVLLIIEGEDSIFWIKNGSREVPGTHTKLILRRGVNPWSGMSGAQFIECVKRVVQNPPFTINIDTCTGSATLDENSFRDIHASSLKDHSWGNHSNVREFEFVINNENGDLVGSAVVGVLEKNGIPVDSITFPSRDIDIDGYSYSLEKEIVLSNNKIELSSTSISIDEDGSVESSNFSTTYAESKSRIALHGIEIPMNLFPDLWGRGHNQVNLSWPFPMLIIVDVCGQRDLDLNSARDKIILSDKWVQLESELARIVCCNIKMLVSRQYWVALEEIFRECKSQSFLQGFAAACNNS